jgi:hypothetical protein
VAVSQRKQQPEREAYSSRQSSAEGKNKLYITSSMRVHIYGVMRKRVGNFTICLSILKILQHSVKSFYVLPKFTMLVKACWQPLFLPVAFIFHGFEFDQGAFYSKEKKSLGAIHHG